MTIILSKFLPKTVKNLHDQIVILTFKVCIVLIYFSTNLIDWVVKKRDRQRYYEAVPIKFMSNLFENALFQT